VDEVPVRDVTSVTSTPVRDRETLEFRDQLEVVGVLLTRRMLLEEREGGGGLGA
jgi:hypothetical protein